MQNVLKLEKITKTYGEGRTVVHALKDLDLSIAEKEIVLIMGPSGSGKTTLLSIAGGILKPSKGIVYVNGNNISQLSEKELPRMRREQVGFIFQSYLLFGSLSAVENVELAGQLMGNINKNIHRRAIDLLQNLGLTDRLNAVPADLSGGEKQRVAIARALINQPSIILADEPTANLDSKRGHEVVGLLRDIAKKQGKSVLIVSHDERIKNIADRVLWLEDGQFQEE